MNRLVGAGFYARLSITKTIFCLNVNAGIKPAPTSEFKRFRHADRREDFMSTTVTVQTEGATRSNQWLVWAGRIVSVAPVLIVLMSSRWKLTANPWYVREWARLGWQTPDLPFIASLQLGTILLYVIPR